MKKIICLLLAILMLTSLIACDTTPDPVPSDSDNANSTEAADTTVTSDEATTEVSPTGKYEAPAYTGVFKTGYDRQDVTPSGDIKLKDGTLMTSVLDRVYVTCIAVNDGDQPSPSTRTVL